MDLTAPLGGTVGRCDSSLPELSQPAGVPLNEVREPGTSVVLAPTGLLGASVDYTLHRMEEHRTNIYREQGEAREHGVSRTFFPTTIRSDP
jgi:hypothetical protein